MRSRGTRPGPVRHSLGPLWAGWHGDRWWRAFGPPGTPSGVLPAPRCGSADALGRSGLPSLRNAMVPLFRAFENGHRWLLPGR